MNSARPQSISPMLPRGRDLRLRAKPGGTRRVPFSRLGWGLVASPLLALLLMIRLPSVALPNTAGPNTAVSPADCANDASFGVAAWANPGAVTVSDDIYASVTVDGF